MMMPKPIFAIEKVNIEKEKIDYLMMGGGLEYYRGGTFDNTKGVSTENIT